MTNLTDLSVLLENVWLGSTINECVLIVADGMATVKAMDMTSSVYVETSAKTTLEDDTLAFGNIGLLIKYLKANGGIDAEIVRSDNRLTIKPKGGATLKFLLSEPDLIPTYDASWEEGGNRIAELLAGYKSELILTKESVTEFSSLMRMFGTKSAVLRVSKKGVVTITGGNETEHQFTATIGKAEFEVCDISLIVKNLLAVLDVLDYTENPVLRVSPGKAIVISCNESTWVLSPDDATPEE